MQKLPEGSSYPKLPFSISTPSNIPFWKQWHKILFKKIRLLKKSKQRNCLGLPIVDNIFLPNCEIIYITGVSTLKSQSDFIYSDFPYFPCSLAGLASCAVIILTSTKNSTYMISRYTCELWKKQMLLTIVKCCVSKC